MNPIFMMKGTEAIGRAAGYARFPLGSIVPLIIGVALVAAVVFLIIRNKKLKKNNDSSENILKERLAKGEINAEEYENLKTALKK